MRWLLACALALTLAGCASGIPCLSTITTSVEGGSGWGTRHDVWGGEPAFGRENANDVRAGVSLEWDATGAACEQ